MKKSLSLAILCATVFLCSSGARAQNAISTGSISGHVTDNSGGVILGVKVTATSVETGVQRTTKTSEAGLYNFPGLNVGAYTLTFNQSGFKTTEIKNVVVQVGQATSEDVSLQVGAVSESVTVTAEAPLLHETESSLSTVVNQQLIEDLPLSGRRYTDFVLLTPNATADGDFGLVSIAGQQGGSDSGYGNGNGSNSFTLDGANATSGYYGDARGRTRVPYVFGEQAIQEFQVADSPYSAVYGGAGTGFINTVTKSGGDSFHGDAFYYNRNSGVGNANDAIDKANGIRTPLNVLQQFGGDLGGPVARHKAWFYFDYEQQRQKEPISVINSGFAGIDETAFGVTQGTALPAPNATYPVPSTFSAPPPSTDTTHYPIYLQQVSNALSALTRNLGQRQRRRDDLEFLPKLDWQPTQADHLTFLYNYNRFNSPGGTITFNPVSGDGIEALPNNFVRDHHATVHWTHTFGSNLLNDLHVSYLRDEQIATPSGLTNPSIPSIGMLAPGFGPFFSLGNPTYSVGDTKEFQSEIGEQLNWIHGRHDFKFGFDFNRTHVTDFFPANFLGTYFFLSPTDFALGTYNNFTQASGNAVFPFTVPYYGFYAQDKFRISSRLTLDLGLREDFQVYPQPRENPAFPLTGQFPNHYNRLAPRLGFAYQPFSKTVVRGGFGWYYDLFNGINYENSAIGNGLKTQQASTKIFFTKGTAPSAQVPTFPANLPSSFSGFSGSTNISLVDPGFRTPYVLESNLEIQRELFANTTVTVGTMWTHGVHLIASSAYDLNLMPPSGTTTFTFCPGGFTSGPPEGCAGAPGPTVTGPTLDNGLLTEQRIAPSLNQINALISPGVNNYNSLYVRIDRRVSHGLSLLTSYTFSKNMQTSMDFNNQFDFRDTHGPSLLDQRHRVSVAAVYAPSTEGIVAPWAHALLSNWTVSTVMQFGSGRPYTSLLNSSTNGGTVNDSAANETTGNTAAGIAGSGPTPGIGFNSFYGPWIEEIDLGIRRDFHITERHTISLEAQAFNLFNHPNFYVQFGGGINQVQFTPNGGTCGDGATANQKCFLVPNPGFGNLQSINELNGPRIFQFAFRYRF